MLFERIGRDGAKSSEPDVERHPGSGDSLRLELAKEPVGEVQAGRRGGHGARLAGEDGLVMLDVVGPHFAFANVGRQRHSADPLQQGEGLGRILGLDDPGPAGQPGHELQQGVFRAVATNEPDGLALAHAAAGFAQNAPQAVLGVQLKEKPLPTAARPSPVADQPSRHHLGVVKNQAIPWP